MSLQFKILTPSKTLYRGPARAVSSVNETGPFSILPGHTNFISLIRQYVVLQLPDRSSKRFSITQGVLYCRRDQVAIYTGIKPRPPKPSPAMSAAAARAAGASSPAVPLDS